MLAIVAGFLGVLLVMHPGIGTVHWAMLIALVATIGYALYNLATRYLAAFDPPEVTQTYTPLAGAIVLMPFALAGLAWPARPHGDGCCSPRSASGAGSAIGCSSSPIAARRPRCWRRSSISA